MAGFLSQSDKIPPDRIKRSVTTKMSSDMKEAADTCLIVSGGPTDQEFAAKFVKERKYPYVIAVDAGLTDHSLFPTPRLRHSPHHSPQWNYSEIQHDNRNNP